SRSTERRNMLRTTAATTNQGAVGPMVTAAIPPMNRAGQPSSVSARAAARQTETYEMSVLEARTTGMRGVVGNLAIGVLYGRDDDRLRRRTCIRIGEPTKPNSCRSWLRRNRS